MKKQIATALLGFLLSLLLVFIALAPMPVLAQSQEGLKLSYTRISNGKVVEGQDPIMVLADATHTLISAASIQAGKAALPFEQSWIHRGKNEITQVAQLSANESVAMVDASALAKQVFEFSDEVRVIQGYRCKKAKTIVNSNTIELWYAEDSPVKAAPTILGQNLGLVLEQVRNGNFVITATQIERMPGLDLNGLWQKEQQKGRLLLDSLSYKDRLWQSRFTKLSIFENQIINFSGKAPSGDAEVLRFAQGTVVLKRVQFPEIKVGSQVFVELQEQSNGDAYDRTGSVFLIPEDKKRSFLDGLQQGVAALPVYENGNGKKYQGVVATPDYSPLVELMRFFTPFGIQQYNYLQLKGKTWHERAPYRMEISNLSSHMSGKSAYVGVFIGNYDQGGHKISMNISIHTSEVLRQKPLVSIPLFNTVNIMEMASQEYATMFDHEKGLQVSFELKQALKNAKLRYIVTGHGGWENGDEYLPKKNTILLNGKKVFAFVPWRQDCGSYRLFNPASGNFNDGLSSSDFSRSNWCPGTATNPVYIDLGDLKAGRHTLAVKIPQEPKEGESFSAWNVSGVLQGEGR